MAIALDRTARRILGVLVEKEATTPNLYPLTVNAVLSGCNQRSNRDPVLDLREHEVEAALRDLMIREWVTNVTTPGSRTMRWRHRVGERLNVGGRELAVLGELLLRGAQQPGELRVHASRMVPIEDLAALDAIVDALESKGLVRRLKKRPGERAIRIDHTLHAEGEGGAAEAALPDGERGAAEASPALDAPGAGAPGTMAPSPGAAERLAELERRVARLERRLDDLVGPDEAR